MLKRILPLLILMALSPGALNGANVLREMKYTIEDSKGYINRRADYALLIIKSNVVGLKLRTEKDDIMDQAIKDGGIYHYWLKGGREILTISSDGCTTLENIRITLPIGQTPTVLKITAMSWGATADFQNTRPTVILNYKAEAGEIVQGGLENSVMTFAFSGGKTIIRPQSGDHIITLNSQGRIWRREFTVKEGEKLSFDVVFTGTRRETNTELLTGGLRVETTPPGATIYINGVDHGRTPQTISNMAPGSYRLEIVHELYLPESMNIELAGSGYITQKFDLRPNFGCLHIGSDPGQAMVYINNQLKGPTPLAMKQLAVGNYVIRLSKQMFYDSLDTLSIQAGDKLSRNYKLPPRFGPVTIQSTPPGASVRVDGVSWGKTPLRHDQTPSGDHIVNLRLNNYFTEDFKITVQDGVPLRKNVQMRASMGWLNITSTPPGAEVRLKSTNRRLGTTPIDNLPLKEGTHVVVFNRDLYEESEETLSLTLGETRDLKSELHRKTGQLEVLTGDLKARILLFGEYGEFRGSTPATILSDIPTGTYVLRITKGGYDTIEQDVVITHNKRTTVSERLSTEGTEIWKSQRAKSRKLALFLPGAAQWRSGQRLRGALYTGGTLAASYLIFLSQKNYRINKRSYDTKLMAYTNANTQVNIDRYYDATLATKRVLDRDIDIIKTMVGVIGGIYITQLLDAMIFGGGEKPISGSGRLGLIQGIEFRGSDGTGSLGARVGVGFGW